MRSDKHITISTEESRNEVGTAFHSEYRSIQTKVNNAAHTTTKNSFRAQRGGSAREGVRATELWDRLPSHCPHWKCDVRSQQGPPCQRKSMEINTFSPTNKIIKKIWILWLTSITPSGIITELSQIIVFEKQTIKKNFRKMKFTIDKRQKIW